LWEAVTDPADGRRYKMPIMAGAADDEDEMLDL
jgi:hypothetical protein